MAAVLLSENVLSVAIQTLERKPFTKIWNVSTGKSVFDLEC